MRTRGNINWMHNFGLVPNPADKLHPIRADFWNESPHRYDGVFLFKTPTIYLIQTLLAT